MAFSFVVEEGTADPDANSYVTVEFADDYAETNTFHSADWLALSDDTKERLLVRSSKIIDARIRWNGDRVDEDSGLRWPRSGVYDRDGFLIADNVIPVILQEAVVEFALYLMSYDWTAPRTNSEFRQIEVGPINIRFDQEYSQGAFPDIISSMLDGLGYLDEGRRPAFKKVIRT